MSSRTSIFFRTIGFALLCALPAGCGGGGSGGAGGGGTPPTPVATAGSCSISSTVTCSVLTFSSSPQGLAVKLNGSAIGVTPLTSSPGFSTIVNSYTITASGSAAPFPFAFEQVDNGNHTIFYNQSADTTGSIGSIATSDAVRRAKADAPVRLVSRVHRLSLRLANRNEFDQKHVLVLYRASTLQVLGKTIADVETRAGVTQSADVGPYQNDTITRVVSIPSGQTAATVIANLRQNKGVVDAYRPRMRYAFASTPITPNDLLFNTQDQWDMYRISAPNAWGYTLGSTSIAIAIVDTGVDVSQGDFGGSKVTFAEQVLNGVTTAGTAAAVDMDGHGTNVAGIAAAGTNNAFGFAGAGYNTSLQAYRIFPTPIAPLYMQDPNYGTNTADEAKAINDAVLNGAKVINLSLGAPAVDAQGNTGFDVTEYNAVESAISKGVTVVAASGNEAAGVLDFPAAYQGVISVGASALNDGNSNPNVTPTYASTMPDTVAVYSNYGPGLSIVAPGGDPSSATDGDLLHWITNTYSTKVADPSQQCSGNPCLAQIAGTSQATPHVSGAAALMLAQNANLLPAQIAQILESTADDIGDARQGHGRLNLYRALASVAGDTGSYASTNSSLVPKDANFVAIAYTPNGTNKPVVINITYPQGVPVSSSGSFRIADIPAGASGYKIGVWYDANGDGLVDSGDWFGATSSTCAATAPCGAALGISVAPVASGVVLNEGSAAVAL
jgi:subtilisin family serine protease